MTIKPFSEIKSPPPLPFGLMGCDFIDAEGVEHKNVTLIIEDKGYFLSTAITPKDLLKEHPSIKTYYDGNSYLIHPGLCNSHSHAAMSFLRGVSYPGQDKIIQNLFFAREKTLTEELVEKYSLIYLAEGLRCGTTLWIDHYFFAAGTLRAMRSLGVGGLVGETLMDTTGPFLDGLSRQRDLLDRGLYDAFIQPILCPHAMDSVSTSLWDDIIQLQKSTGLGLHMHLSQTQSERAEVQRKFNGETPVKLAARVGILNERTLATHLVSVDEEDIKILKSTGTQINFCPISQILYEKLSPIQMFLENDLKIYLGTDCAASNDSADLYAEAKFAALIARDRGALYPLKALWKSLLGPKNLLGDRFAKDLVFYKKDQGWQNKASLIQQALFALGSKGVEHVLSPKRKDQPFILWRKNITSEPDDPF